jgi:hypothetical protein
MGMRTIAFILLTTLTVHGLVAQTFQLSVNARAIVEGSSTGFEARIGTNHRVWNLDGCVAVQFVKARFEHLFGPDETRYSSDVTPYAELSFHRVVGVGFSPVTFTTEGAQWRPQLVCTFAAPINVWRNIDVFPRLQFQMSLQDVAIPLVFLGVGASYAL